MDPVRGLGAGILQGEGVLVDPTEPFVEVGHDLLRPHDEDDSPRTADVRPELTAAHRGCQQRTGLGDRVDAAEHHVGGCRQAPDLVGLGLTIESSDPWSHGVEASGFLDRIDDPRSLERLRGAVVNLRSNGDESKDDLFRFGRISRPQHREPVRCKGRRSPPHPRLSRKGPELTSHGWIEIEI